MKQTYLVVMAFFCLTISFNVAQAQIWSGLEPVFEQMDPTERENFAEELDRLMESWHYGSVELNGIVDSLVDGMSIYDPTMPVDEMSEAWGTARGNLTNLLDDIDLEMPDSLAIIDEFDRVNEIWDMNLDTLNAVMELYDGETDFPPGLAREAVRRFEVFEGLWTQIFMDVEESVIFGLDRTDPQGLGNMEETIDVLFGSMFELEFAFGQQFSDANYYGEKYSPVASVIRLASVPGFKQDWEARWSIMGSFFTAGEDLLGEASSLQEGFNGLWGSAQFALMYNPLIRNSRGVKIRLYSSLGMEAGVYVPPHVRDYDPRSWGNVGNTTGYGPQIGAGAIVTIGHASMYTYGTLATGDVVEGFDYRFRSQTANAGIRYGNAVNVLYTYGNAMWAPNRNKFMEYHQITIGVILSGLRRQ